MLKLLFLVSMAQHKDLMPNPDKSMLIRHELRMVKLVLLKRMAEQKETSLPSFSTKTPPKWALDGAYLRKLLDGEQTDDAEMGFMSSLYRPWTYEVRPEIAGKDYKLLKGTDVVVWVKPPYEGNRIGICKNEAMKEYLK